MSEGRGVPAEPLEINEDVGTSALEAPNSNDEEELREAVEMAVAEVERARVATQRDQIEIEQLKSETRMMISRLLAA